MRGKEGGIIYSKNAYGNYIKTKVSPTNPQTSYQTTVRARMQALSNAWKDLTQTQKDNWKTLGDQVPRVNRFGDVTTYTGFSLYIKLNLNLLAAGQSTISAAPSVPTIPEITFSAFTAESGTESLTVAMTPSLASSGQGIISYVTPQIFTGRSFVKNLRRFVQFSSEPTTSINMLTAWGARFGALTTGAKLFGAWKVVDEATGFEGALQVLTTTVTAGA